MRYYVRNTRKGWWPVIQYYPGWRGVQVAWRWSGAVRRVRWLDGMWRRGQRQRTWRLDKAVVQ
jgi:hypothetical protein